MNKGNLTIFIPTYNRLEKLKRTLNYLLSFLDRYNFSILIGNNASTDKTNDCLTSLSNPNISFYTNSSNIGITKNICKGIQKIDTEWTWVFGDDDFFHPKALEIFFREKSYKQTGFYFRRKNFKKFDISLAKEEKSDLIETFSIKEDTILEALGAGFITSFILKTNELVNIFLNVIEKDETLNYNAYTNKLVCLLYESKYGFNISKDVLVFQDISNGSHFTQNIDNVFKVFVRDELYIYKKLEESDISYIDLYRKTLFSKSILRPFYFYRMEKGETVKKELIDIVKIYKLPFYYRIITKAPSSLLKLFYKLYKKVKRENAFLENAENI